MPVSGEEEDVPDPPDDVPELPVDVDELPEDELPAEDPPLFAVALFSAFTALFAAAATLETEPRLGALVEDVPPLPDAAENGLRLRPTKSECAGID